MSTTIPCSVDTRPMADEIQSVSNHIKGTTAAVVTMHTAVIAAETAGTVKVCQNVNRGFFTLVRSQISQKIASKQSRVEALLMKLGQQKRGLLTIRNNMEREYGRIAERYLRIFTSINKELESRIRQVDRPVFDLVNKEMTTASNRMNALSAWSSTMQSESATDSQRILVSHLKADAQDALERSRDFLAHVDAQRRLTESVLISGPAGNADCAYAIPVAVCTTVSDVSGFESKSVQCPDGLPEADRRRITAAVGDAAGMKWTGKPAARVTDEFNRLVDRSRTSDRVKSMIRKLYSSSSYKTF